MVKWRGRGMEEEVEAEGEAEREAEREAEGESEGWRMWERRKKRYQLDVKNRKCDRWTYTNR